MQSGNDTVSRASVLAHGAAFLALGFGAGFCARAAVELLAMPVDAGEPRDEFIVTPATKDSPAMVIWAAAELDDLEGTRVQTLSYHWSDADPQPLPGVVR